MANRESGKVRDQGKSAESEAHAALIRRQVLAILLLLAAALAIALARANSAEVFPRNWWHVW